MSAFPESFRSDFEHTVRRIYQTMGEIARAHNVKLSVTISYNADSAKHIHCPWTGAQVRTYGWFEFGGDDERWYASGGLWFQIADSKATLVDYDGIYSLPDFVLIHLHKKGFDVKDMADTLKITLPEEDGDSE